MSRLPTSSPGTESVECRRRRSATTVEHPSSAVALAMAKPPLSASLSITASWIGIGPILSEIRTTIEPLSQPQPHAQPAGGGVTLGAGGGVSGDGGSGVRVEYAVGVSLAA